MRPDAEAGKAEVWVVDNASSDGSAELVEREYPWVKLVASEVNLGYGRAVNLVAERSGAAWIAPANDDIELRPGTLERLLEAGREHPRAGILAPRLELPGGGTQHSVNQFPTLWFTAVFNLGLHRLSPRLGDRLCLEGLWDPDRPRDVPWAHATFLLVRREAFDAIGGFARDQFIHAEDVDLAWRLRSAGWSTRYEPTARVLHAGSVATIEAFGLGLRGHWMDATYSWIARTRGVAIARAVAVINLAGSGARWLVLGAIAKLGAKRFAAPAATARAWTMAHRSGLRARADLLREH